MPSITLAERVCFGLAGFLQESYALETQKSLSELVLHAEAFKLLHAADRERDVAINVQPKRWEDRPGTEAVDLAIPQQREWKAFIEMKYLKAKKSAGEARLLVVQDLARLAACTEAAKGKSERLLIVCFNYAAWTGFKPTSNVQGVGKVVGRLLVRPDGEPAHGEMTYPELQQCTKRWQERTPRGTKVGLSSGLSTEVVATCGFMQDLRGQSGRIVAWRVTRL